ncbi:hypothetical protein G6F56_000704 [Rhizopus delemar]|nr:hypothetical protein G6F56_000704 [Rhizopus delemar]
MKDGRGRIATEEGGEAMDYIIEEEEQFNLRNLTNLTDYKKSQPVPIELDPEDEDLEIRHPAARNDEQRTQKRYEWVIKYDNSDMNYLQNCIFIDESGFDINMRPSYGRSASESESRAVAKRKVANSRKTEKKGTTTGHYLKFLVGTIDQLDKYPELKGFYLVMDNASIHNHEDIEHLITDRGYRCVYLPPYSPELNPIEQFWSTVKNRVRRSKFEDKEDLFTRISEAYNFLHIIAMQQRLIQSEQFVFQPSAEPQPSTTTNMDLEQSLHSLEIETLIRKLLGSQSTHILRERPDRETRFPTLLRTFRVVIANGYIQSTSNLHRLLGTSMESTGSVDLRPLLDTQIFIFIQSFDRPKQLGALLRDSLFPPKPTTTFSTGKWKTFWDLPIPPGVLTVRYRAIHHKLPNKSLLHNIVPDSFPSATCIHYPQTEDTLNLFLYDLPH